MGIRRAALACVAAVLLAATLGCEAADRDASSRRSHPVGMGLLRGEVQDSQGRPLAGALVTAHDDNRTMNVSVFTDGEGRYEFPALELGTYELRVRIVGFERRERVIQLTEKGAYVEFLLPVAGLKV